MNQVVFWLILLIILVAIEIATMGLTTIWFAGGAFVAIIAAALNTPLYVQITLFLIVSVVLLLFTRPIAMKYFNKDRIKTNAESLIGKQAVVTEDIDNLLAVGLVRGQDIAEGSVEVDSSSFFAAEEKKTIKAIQTAAFTGNHGDGKIISYDLKSALRIRTGETDKDAIN